MRSRKGLTLVELILAVAFTAVIIAAAVAALYFAQNTFKSGSVNAVNQQKATLAETYFQRYGSTAYDVSTSESQTTQGIFFSVAGNRLTVRRQKLQGGIKTVENLALIDGISRVEITVQNRTMNYRIVSEDNSYTLSGGLVVNNLTHPISQNVTLQNDAVLFLQENLD